MIAFSKEEGKIEWNYFDRGCRRVRGESVGATTKERWWGICI